MTSREILRKLEESDQFSLKDLLALRDVQAHPGTTSKEFCQRFEGKLANPQPLFAGLVQRGVLVVSGDLRECTITGRRVRPYSLISDLPPNFDFRIKKATTAESENQACQQELLQQVALETSSEGRAALQRGVKRLARRFARPDVSNPVFRD